MKLSAKDKRSIIKRMRGMVPLFAARVAPIYSLLNWKWITSSGNMEVPGLAEIELCLLHLIDELAKDKKSTRNSSGGLEVCFTEDCGIFHGELRFGIDMWILASGDSYLADGRGDADY